MNIDHHYDDWSKEELKLLINFRNTDIYKRAMINVADRLIKQEPKRWNDMYIREFTVIVNLKYLFSV